MADEPWLARLAFSFPVRLRPRTPLRMRILFAGHAPLDESPTGRAWRTALERLRAAGHDVRALVVDGDPQAPERPHIRRVVCHGEAQGAPLRFAAPSFNGSGATSLNFAEMTDRQLSEYRDVLRIEFDREIDLHDPHIVHTQQLWLFAHLALEAGVPYAVSAQGDEFAIGKADVRYRRFMIQAAENAGRILTHSDDAHAGVSELVGELEGRVRRCPTIQADDPATANWYAALPGLYRETFVERFGSEPS